MSARSEAAEAAGPANVMGRFERYLSVWVALAIAVGLVLGQLAPGVFAALAGLEIAHVNLVIAVLIWAMVYPMMINVDFASLAHIGDKPKGLAVTLSVNWLIKPFTMAGLGLLCFNWLFAGLIPADEAQSYIAGLILLGAAPCTAMVFVWSQLTRGDATYTLVQVAVNDLIMIFAFAPLVALLLGLADVVVPWATLLLSVALYVVLPLLAGMATRRYLLRRGGEAAVAAYTDRVKPATIIGLVVTVLILFAFQGERLLANPFVIALIATPLILQTAGIFALTYFWARAWRIPLTIGARGRAHRYFQFLRAGGRRGDQPVRAAFGGGAGATVVGVLVEVPLMLALVAHRQCQPPLVCAKRLTRLTTGQRSTLG